jgi:hypothetical protein
MTREKRRDIRKEYLEEISFESMLTDQSGRGVVIHSGRSMDMSRGGLGLASTYKATEGEVVKLSIPLNRSDMTVPVFAEVMWVMPFNEYYKAGLRFLR